MNRSFVPLPSASLLCFALVLFRAGAPAGFAQGLPQLESKALSVSQENRQQWHSVTFDTTFSQTPVVVMGPPSNNDGAEAMPLVRNVTAQGFEFQLAEWEYLDGAHAEETVSYLAIEPGSHDLGGLVCQAGRTTLAATSNEQPGTVSFPDAFAQAPVVMCQAVFPSTTTEALALRVTGKSAQSFSVRRQREEARGNGAPELEVDWIAVQAGWGHDWTSGTSFLVQEPSTPVTSEFTQIDFLRGTVNATFLAGFQSFADTDPAVLRYQGLGNRGVELSAQEEASLDPDVEHGGETIGTLAIWHMPEPKLEVGELDLAALQAGQWVPIEVAAEYENPVVVLGPATSNDSDPVTLRVRNAGPTGFEVALQEYDSQDGIHGTEHVPYLIMEEGIFQIGGKVWVSGTANGVAPDGNHVELFPAFTEAPVILGQVASDSDPAAAVTRVSGVDETGFDLALQSEEAATEPHGAELVHYIAVGSGTSSTTTGLAFESGITQPVHDQAWKQVSFARDYQDPLVFAATQTTNTTEPSGVRRRMLDQGSVEFMVQEETSADAETVVENPESLGWLVVGSTAYRKGDHDEDGMPDDWETANGLNPAVNDAALDPDGDGLSNLEEYLNGGLPENPDTDGDGYLDGFELVAGWNPALIDGSSIRGVPKPITKLTVFTPSR